MENLNAPQWIDFEAGANPIDDEIFFNVEHTEHERPRLSNDMANDSFTDTPNSNASFLNHSNNSSSVNAFCSPMTCESLVSGINALYINSARKNFAKRCLTPRTPRVAYENNGKDISPQEQPQGDATSGDNIKEENSDKNAILVPSNGDTHLTSEPAEKVDTLEDCKPKEKKPEKPNNAQSKPRNRSDPSRKLMDDRNNVKKKSNKPTVLTSQARRLSTARNRRQSGQFVSLAEALSRFQNRTPTRFRSTKRKENEAKPPQKSKQTKTTCPKSPVLRSKERTRTVATSKQKQGRLKANSKSTTVPCSSSSAPEKSTKNAKPLKKIDNIQPVSAAERKQPKLSPKVRQTFEQINRMIGEQSTKDPNIGALLTPIRSETMRRDNTPSKITAPTIVSTKEGMKIKEVEVLHFGIPVVNDYKKMTRTQPFSFDTRNKDLESKRKKLEQMQIEGEKSRKSSFHAKPAPPVNPVKKTAVLKSNENNDNKGNPTVSMLSFKERNELALKKKKELMERVVEKEKKARIFHAKPAPTFKPVAIRGISTNTKIGDKNKSSRETLSAAKQQGHRTQESVASDNQENTVPIDANQPCPK